MTKLFENDQELSKFIDKLVKNKKICDIVKMLKPLEIAQIMATDLDLTPEKASNSAINLIKQIHDGLAVPSIETNKAFPVPASIRGTNDTEDPEDNEMDKAIKVDESGENYINNLGQTTPDFSNSLMFPQPREDEEGWPYGGTVQAKLEPQNNTRGKRGLTCGKIKTYKFSNKPPFKQDLRTNEPGGDAGASGIYQRLSRPMDNSEPEGGSSWDTKGRPGWSSAMGEFDLPDEPRESVKEKEYDFDKLEEPAPVGSPIPSLNNSGPNNPTRKGFRRR